MRIQNKLIAIFFITSVVLVVAQVLVMQWSIGKGMIDYVNERELKALNGVAASLASLYEKEDSWIKIRGDHRRFRKIIKQGLTGSEFDSFKGPRRPNRPPNRSNDPRSNDPRSDFAAWQSGLFNQPKGRRGEFGGPPPNPEVEVSYALLDLNKELLVGYYPAKQSFNFIDVLVEEQLVGFLAVSKRVHLAAGYELNFVEQQQRYIALIAIGLILIAMFIAMPLAAHFVKPITQLTAAMSMLTSGEYQQRIDLKRKDEFAQLSRDFNELAATLQQNEQARKRWLADVSHELRTPVTVLKGELESMLDGVRPLSLERIKSSNEEVKQLEKLIDDLHELTRNDLGTLHYRKESLDFVALLQGEANHYYTLLSEKGIAVKFAALPKDAIVFADIKRLKQLLGNLFSNTAKYASGGNTLKISVDIEQHKHEVHLRLEDNGPGVNEANLAKLFEHLFRVENSRNRNTGGSGLGLSISKKIVEAHHGEISAFASDLGGLGILIILPME
ncbi:MAG: HAMP domain-containing protein [Paraglaciecola sp.]|nr:HAMP domain-containing protein [Paraglaciecola sp.]